VAGWQKIYKMQQQKVDWLNGKKKIEIKGRHVDLTLSIKDRSFINSSGDKNMPSGEVYISPVEDSVTGWVEFIYPIVRAGREVKGVRLEFKKWKGNQGVRREKRGVPHRSPGYR